VKDYLLAQEYFAVRNLQQNELKIHATMQRGPFLVGDSERNNYATVSGFVSLTLKRIGCWEQKATFMVTSEPGKATQQVSEAVGEINMDTGFGAFLYGHFCGRTIPLQPDYRWVLYNTIKEVAS
jgi:hypothetical protein